MFGLCHQLAITLVYVHILIHKIKKYFFDEKPLICSDKTIIPYPSLPSTVCGGKKFLLRLPFPFFDLVHMQYICFLSTDEQRFTRTAFTW